MNVDVASWLYAGWRWSSSCGGGAPAVEVELQLWRWGGVRADGASTSEQVVFLWTLSSVLSLQVEYQCEGFLEKNRDTVYEEQINILKASQVETRTRTGSSCWFCIQCVTSTLCFSFSWSQICFRRKTTPPPPSRPEWTSERWSRFPKLPIRSTGRRWDTRWAVCSAGPSEPPAAGSHPFLCVSVLLTFVRIIFLGIGVMKYPFTGWIVLTVCRKL